MTFTTLTIITAAALVGPLLAAPRRTAVPMVIGELAAGVLLGNTGLRTLHPHDPTFAFLADIGFGLIMFVAGSHVPIRNPRVRSCVRTGGLRALSVAGIAIGLAVAIAHAFGTGGAPLFAVLLASSSAALALPLLESVGVDPGSALDTVAQIAIADTACIVALPLAIEPSRAGRAAVGAVAVAGGALLFWMVFEYAEHSGQRRRLHHFSERRHFALELRISLLALFGLAAIATNLHVSIMLAGFGLGLAVAAVGAPRRLARQVFGLTEGFLGPIFFVWIGASLDLRALGNHPKFIVMGVVLGLAAVGAHAAMAPSGQGLKMSVLASAQLGVPIAAVTLGSQRHLLPPGEAAAILLGAVVTVAAASIAAARSRPVPVAPDLSDRAAPIGAPASDKSGAAGR